MLSEPGSRSDRRFRGECSRGWNLLRLRRAGLKTGGTREVMSAGTRPCLVRFLTGLLI